MDWSYTSNSTWSLLEKELSETLPSSLTSTSFAPPLLTTPNPFYQQNYTPKFPSAVDKSQQRLNQFSQSNYSQPHQFIQPHIKPSFTVKNDLEVDDQRRVDHSSGLITASATDNANTLPEADRHFASLEYLEQNINIDELFKGPYSFQIEALIQEPIIEENERVVAYLTDKLNTDSTPAYPTTLRYQQQQHPTTDGWTVHHENHSSIDQDDHREARGNLPSCSAVQVRPHTRPYRRRSTSSSNSSTSQREYSDEELERRRRNTDSYKRSIAKKKRIQKENEMLLKQLERENAALNEEVHFLKTEVNDVMTKISQHISMSQSVCFNLPISNYLAKKSIN